MQTLFDTDRLSLDDALQLTAASLREHGQQKHWAIAFSGGKDSTALVTAIVHLIDAGLVPRPESLVVQYADTRMELPPLQICAMAILKTLAKRGIETKIVLPPLDERFFVYMLGRGVPPPKNKFRRLHTWLTMSRFQARAMPTYDFRFFFFCCFFFSYRASAATTIFFGTRASLRARSSNAFPPNGGLLGCSDIASLLT